MSLTLKPQAKKPDSARVCVPGLTAVGAETRVEREVWKKKTLRNSALAAELRAERWILWIPKATVQQVPSPHCADWTSKNTMMTTYDHKHTFDTKSYNATSLPLQSTTNPKNTPHMHSSNLIAVCSLMSSWIKWSRLSFKPRRQEHIQRMKAASIKLTVAPVWTYGGSPPQNPMKCTTLNL